jgi:hypothetical protein
MHPVLDSLHKSYADVLDKFTTAKAQLHPDGDESRWSAQEIVEHLILSYRSTTRVLEERLAKGRPTQAQVTPEQEERWRRTIGADRFPNAGKSPDAVLPGQANFQALSGNELAVLFEAELGKLDTLLDACSGKFGSQPMASHFAFGPLSSEQWREFHAVHGRHHLAQLSRLI